MGQETQDRRKGNSCSVIVLRGMTLPVESFPYHCNAEVLNDSFSSYLKIYFLAPYLCFLNWKKSEIRNGVITRKCLCQFD